MFLIFFYEDKKERSILKCSKTLFTALKTVERGEILQRELGNMLINRSIGETSQKIITGLDRDKYKYYTDLVLNLVHAVIEYGRPMQDSFRSLRENLANDLRAERKLIDIYYNSIWQMVIISCIIWGLVLFANSSLQLSVSIFSIISVLSLHLVGFFLYVFLHGRVRAHMFASFYRIYSILYSISYLSRVGLSVSEVRDLAEYDRLSEVKGQNFTQVKDRLQELMRLWIGQGEAIGDEIKDLIIEIDVLHQIQFRRFERNTLALRISVITLFFLSSYFLFWISIFFKSLY